MCGIVLHQRDHRSPEAPLFLGRGDASSPSNSYPVTLVPVAGTPLQTSYRTDLGPPVGGGGSGSAGAHHCPPLKQHSARARSFSVCRHRFPSATALLQNTTAAREVDQLGLCPVCRPNRSTVEEHQVGAQRALARRVAHLEQRLWFPRGGHSPAPSSPLAPWPERQRAGRPSRPDGTGRQHAAHAGHRDQAPWIVSLEAYRAVRRDLRVCRQSLADLTATLASVAASDDPVLASPPLHLPHPPAPLRTPTAMSDRTDRKHWGGTSRRPADAFVPLLPPVALQGVEPVEPVEWSDHELLSAGVQVCAPPVACRMRRCAAARRSERPATC